MRPADGTGAERAEILALLRLMAVPRLGAATLRVLLRAYGSGVAAVEAVGSGRAAFPAELARALGSERVERTARRGLAELVALDAHVLVLGTARYPAAFAALADAPPVVFCRGRVELLAPVHAVAIIGARRCTPYGAESARMLAAGLAGAGVVIVSGLARGIDGAAHRGALDVGGATVGVLGTGLGVAYPTEHAGLQEAIGESGLLVSEVAPCQPGLRHQFPARNRLITALVRGLIVVEAGPRSGTRATVDRALDGGVEVFAVPGPIGRPQSEGTHTMIREGAALATSAEEVLATLQWRPMPGVSVSGQPAVPGAEPPIGHAESRLLAALAGWELSLDDLVERSGLAVSEALPALLALEVAGRVARRPGARFAALPDAATRETARV